MKECLQPPDSNQWYIHFLYVVGHHLYLRAVLPTKMCSF